MKKPATRKRAVTRIVHITEKRCSWCGEWFEYKRVDARLCPTPRTCRLESWRAQRRLVN